MGIKTKRWEFFSEFLPDEIPPKRLSGISFAKLFLEMKEANIKHLKIIFEEIVDWDIAPMRKFFHGVQLPAFVEKINEAYQEPKHGHFTNLEVKDFLKVKFLGWDKDSPGWEKWHKVLSLNKEIDNILDFLMIQNLNRGLDEPIRIIPTERKTVERHGYDYDPLTPEQYWVFIKDCEKLYFVLFEMMYDVREMPEEPK